MYKVMICIQDTTKKTEERQVFELGDMDSDGYRDQMNAISDYLYNLDIPFDVDADGDMMIDDILMNLSDEEDFEESFSVGKKIYRIQGTGEDAS